ncbi:thiamine-phosphate kinase [Altererythrobacter salegens]|uniref:Thiamine-monophosphate kinase n=1 Tax=Croceibacterium salegens TaxID=1737568 RepID=A0A6I4SYU2_9SPHN|nr:thiamine-phosphate kinase [Croceibacterium salegens]MXO60217.1 thiamine-phosphate kinase [Croceibacterium salegens]
MKGEAAFVAALRHLVYDPAARGLADDCAVIELGNEALVLTHDMLVEGVHVFDGADPADIAWKLVAVNLSDLAAKGARPLGVLLGHMLGDRDDRFLAGLHDVLNHYGVPLLGGDTVAGEGRRAWGLTAVGRATHRPVPSRSGARAGDAIWVTGEIGAAMLGFEALRDKTGADSTAYRRPMARLAEGEALAPLVTAMMDVSDGLLLDSSRIAEASGVTLSLDSKAIPLATHIGRLHYALRWGDDYELLFTLPEGVKPPVKATRIGKVLEAGSTGLLLDGNEPEGELGWMHGT